MTRTALVAAVMAAALPTDAYADRPLPFQRRGDYAVGIAASGLVAPDLYATSGTVHFDWTMADGFSLGALGSITGVRAGGANAQLWAALVEPAYHARLSKTAWAFLGLGIGTAWARELGTQAIVAPRFGLHLLVGKRSVITPAIAFRAVTHGVIEPAEDDDATRALTRGVGLELGYAIRW